jgi:hypothetical protein
MPLPPGLRELVGTAAFWADYFGDGVFGEHVPGLPEDPYLELPLPPRHSLRVGYFWPAAEGEHYIQPTQLRFRRADGGPDALLGWWLPGGDGRPYVLRWEEADLIGRLQALKDPELPHPGVPFLLLLPFIASVEGTDHRLGLRLLHAALRSLGVFSGHQMRYRLSASARSPMRGEWRQVGNYGWVCQPPGGRFCVGDSVRFASNLHFPFAAWNDCMRQAEREVAASPQGPVGEEEAEPLPPRAKPIELRYQVTNSEAAYATLPALRRTLFQEGLGFCELTGGWKATEDDAPSGADLDHPNAGDEYALFCHAKLREVVAAVRRVVEAAGRPEVRLYQRLRHGTGWHYRRIEL